MNIYTEDNISSEEIEEFINQNKLTIIDFYAPWCKPCNMLKTALDPSLNSSKKDGVFIKLDIDSALGAELASTYNVRNIPTIIIFSDAKTEKRIFGFNPDIVNEIKTLING